MRAAVFHGRGDIRTEDVADPTPGPGELLLEIRATGICGTDAHEYAHGPTMFPIHERHPGTGHKGPMIPGHELAGEVVAMGEGVTGFTTGQLVVSGAGISCGHCWQCRRGLTNLSESYSSVGLQRDGGLAQFCALPAQGYEDHKASEHFQKHVFGYAIAYLVAREVATYQTIDV